MKQEEETKVKWQDNGRNMCIGTHESGCFISYLPGDVLASTPLLASMSVIFGDEEGPKSGETALYDGKTWYILNGDWRKEYEKLYPDFNACLEFYRSKEKEFRSVFSTNE